MSKISNTATLQAIETRVNPVWSTVTALLARLRRPSAPRRSMNG